MNPQRCLLGSIVFGCDPLIYTRYHNTEHTRTGLASGRFAVLCVLGPVCKAQINLRRQAHVYSLVKGPTCLPGFIFAGPLRDSGMYRVFLGPVMSDCVQKQVHRFGLLDGDLMAVAVA